jgi:hypothetical protein
MPAAKPMPSTDISEIQRRMAQIRHDMHQEVQGAVKGAQVLADWRSLIRSHPWLSMSLASAAGYLIVPWRRSNYPTIVSMGAPTPELLAASSARAQTQQPRRTGWSIVGTAFSLLVPVATRAAQNYALGHLEQWLSQHPLSPSPTGSPDGPRRESGSPLSAGPTNRLREHG